MKQQYFACLKIIRGKLFQPTQYWGEPVFGRDCPQWRQISPNSWIANQPTLPNSIQRCSKAMLGLWQEVIQSYPQW